MGSTEAQLPPGVSCMFVKHSEGSMWRAIFCCSSCQHDSGVQIEALLPPDVSVSK